jgi:dihydropyrimidinase
MEVDASGAFVLPGAIDAHTHLNSLWPFEDERRPVDGFESGSRAAAAGGVTTVCDFVYQLEDGDLRHALDVVQADADCHSVVDYAFHLVVTALGPNLERQVPDLVSDGFPSFKFYTVHSEFAERTSAYMDLIHTVGAAKGLAMFHCEDPGILDYCRRRSVALGRTTPRFYAASRPPGIEAAATALAVHISDVTGTPAYIVHLSSTAALDEVLTARRHGATVFVETRPLYLHLTADAFNQDDALAARYVSTPPLRTSGDRDRLWRGLADSEVDVVATDHVGFCLADKYRVGDTMEQIPKGVANLQTLVPMLFSEGVLTGRITLEGMVDLVATHPAKLFGLYPRKGVIAIGSDADFCVLDPNRTATVAVQMTTSASDFDVYEGLSVTGWPVCTISRGEIIYQDGQVFAPPGRGNLVRGGPILTETIGER